MLVLRTHLETTWSHQGNPAKAGFAEFTCDESKSLFGRLPTRQILDRVGDKWAVLILLLLRFEALRFNQLRRGIEGISQKMLSQVLKSLERDGLVKRRAIATVPVTVEYSITPLGKTLAAAVDPLRDWAETNLKDVLAAQRRYDAQQHAKAA
jgi:DNA-binding HxlR family transcriptional regulator